MAIARRTPAPAGPVRRPAEIEAATRTPPVVQPAAPAPVRSAPVAPAPPAPPVRTTPPGMDNLTRATAVAAGDPTVTRSTPLTDPTLPPPGAPRRARPDAAATAPPEPPAVDPLQPVAATTVPVNVNAGPQNESRALQADTIGKLQAAAAGTSPSVAEKQMVAAMNRAAAQQLGAAAQARGGDALAMNREAMLGIGQQGLAAGADAAAARAAEMTGARQVLAGTVGQMRGQDITAATDTARIDADIAMKDAELKNAMAMGNRDAIVTLTAERDRLQTTKTIADADRELRKYGTDLMAQIQRYGLDQEWAKAVMENNTARQNAIIQGVTSGLAGGAMAVSDQRLKTNINSVPDDKLGSFANRVAEAIFSYDRKDNGKHEIGTMAQTVANAGPLGEDVTGEVAPGVMGVDYGRLATLMAAAALRANKART